MGALSMTSGWLCRRRAGCLEVSAQVGSVQAMPAWRASAMLIAACLLREPINAVRWVRLGMALGKD